MGTIRKWNDPGISCKRKWFGLGGVLLFGTSLASTVCAGYAMSGLSAEDILLWKNGTVGNTVNLCTIIGCSIGALIFFWCCFSCFWGARGRWEHCWICCDCFKAPRSEKRHANDNEEILS